MTESLNYKTSHIEGLVLYCDLERSHCPCFYDTVAERGYPVDLQCVVSPFFHWSDQLIMSIMSCLIVAHNFNILNGLTTKSLGNVKGKLNNVLMHMRKCVNLRFNHLIWLTMHHRCLQHPYLYSQDIEPKGFSSEEEEHEKLIHGSAKLRLLKSLLPQLKERGHRVLLFSQVKNLPSFMVNGDIDEVPKVCDRTGYYRRFPTW